MQRFGSVALIPVWNAEPVTKLRHVVIVERDSAGADNGFVPQRDQERCLAILVRPAYESFRISHLVRMRDARGVFRDAAVVGERCYRFSVLEARCTQRKALGLEDGNTSFAIRLSWNFL